MLRKIYIESAGGEIALDADFLENACSVKIQECLPITSRAKIWGDEIYFDTGITAPGGGGTTEVDIGDIAYWPDGRCLCIFFGPTPASPAERPVPASEVVVVGKASLDPALLRKVEEGSKIKVE